MYKLMQYFSGTPPPAVRPTLLRQMDMGSLTCAHILGVYVHTKGGGGGCSHKQVCPRVDWDPRDIKAVPHPAPPRDRTQDLRIRNPMLYH